MTEHGRTNIKLPPQPVVTRWNSWLEAVQQHSVYADLYPGLIDHMIAKCGPTADLETLQDMLQPAKRKILILQLKYISIMCEPIKTTLLEFEGRQMQVRKVYHKIQEIQAWLAVWLEKTFNAECTRRLSEDGLSTKQATELTESAVSKCGESYALKTKEIHEW